MMQNSHNKLEFAQQHKLYLDTETYSPIPIKYGTYRYAEEAEVIMWQYAIDDGPVIITETLTPELKSMLTDPTYEKIIHNSQFDRIVIREATLIAIPTEQIFDTMVCALTVSLPGALDKLCAILDVPIDQAKDKDGKRLIQMFCCPHKRTNGTTYRVFPDDKPEEWARFLQYGERDIIAMREIFKRLPKWNYTEHERKLWSLDQKINDRGVRVDLGLAKKAIEVADIAKAQYKKEIAEQTNDEVQNATQRNELLNFINANFGTNLTDITAAKLRNLLEDPETCPELAQLISIRLETSKTSTAKYQRLLDTANRDGRLRGLGQFRGAKRTGRYAARLFQHQNLPRSKLSHEELDYYIGEVLNSERQVNIWKYPPMEVLSGILRSVLLPSEGQKWTIADLSNIEGRCLAWEAEENWKIKAFKEFDEGNGHDLYKLTYSKSFNLPIDKVTKDHRQVGKVEELAFGYAGGVGAWLKFAANYRLDLEKLGADMYDELPGELIGESEEFYDWWIGEGKTDYGLSRRAFVVCNAIKSGWRKGHNSIQCYWKLLEDACKQAIENPGQKVVVGMHRIRKDGDWLRISLPSGRSLCYPNARIKDGKIEYQGENQFTKKWEYIGTYGGKLTENITQAIAADILLDAMLCAEEAGYEVAFTVHDEIVASVPDSPEYSSDELCKIMSTNPPWAVGLPLAAAGFEAYRYRKE